MSHAERCPVCAGKGRVEDGYVQMETAHFPKVKDCHGCDGSGWVVVPGDKADEHHYHPPVYDRHYHSDHPWPLDKVYCDDAKTTTATTGTKPGLVGNWSMATQDGLRSI